MSGNRAIKTVILEGQETNEALWLPHLAVLRETLRMQLKDAGGAQQVPWVEKTELSPGWWRQHMFKGARKNCRVKEDWRSAEGLWEFSRVLFSRWETTWGARTIQKDQKDLCLALTQPGKRLLPPPRLKSLITLQALRRLLHNVSPQQWGQGTTLDLPNNSKKKTWKDQMATFK